MTTETLANNVPSHVRPDQVVEWDIYYEDKLKSDPHMGWHSLHQNAPDIFWTPCNAGHWIVTRYDDQERILKDAEHFSSRELDIPPSNSPHVMIPLNLDPPDHTRYRAVLMRYLGVGAIKAMEPKLYAWADRLIDGVIEKGQCDFTETLGAGFPVSVFMELMGMPLERFEEFRKIATEYFSRTTIERRLELQNIIIGIINDLYAEKRRNPKDDLATALQNEEVRGRKLTKEELESIGFLLFIGGLDTVANGLTFAFRHLAGDKALQRRLAAEPDRLSDFVEESLRRYAVVNQTRIVKKDIEINGAHFRVGDMVLCPLTMAGMDDRKNPQPENFDIDRPDRAHITFSIGAHTCLGNMLGRSEMRIFTETWLKRIPQCELAETGEPAWRPGLVMALEHLPLRWDVASTNKG